MGLQQWVRCLQHCTPLLCKCSAAYFTSSSLGNGLHASKLRSKSWTTRLRALRSREFRPARLLGRTAGAGSRLPAHDGARLLTIAIKMST